ncbi:MAG: 1-acyl-sn-glycerol-3-phosphate acyltransferase [Planctomycetes bacterium]|nr:1-acyl-sn-glycerol-3-phosphate acyltransferase [Planctomycetota bacterium]
MDRGTAHTRRCTAALDGRRCGRAARDAGELCWYHEALARTGHEEERERADRATAANPEPDAGAASGPAPAGKDAPPPSNGGARRPTPAAGPAGGQRGAFESGGEIAGRAGFDRFKDAVVGRAGFDRFKDAVVGLRRAVPFRGFAPLERARAILAGDGFDLAAWKGMLTLFLARLELGIEDSRRRRRGDYEVDEFGFDEGYLERVRPFLLFLYRHWFRVESRGAGNVPPEGRALLVGNYSGVLPFDGAMVAIAVWEEQPSPRYVRPLYSPELAKVPFLSTALHRTGNVGSSTENMECLLEKDQLVLAFPEGMRAARRDWRERFRQERFGRGEFARSAIRTASPVVPVSVEGLVGAHPVLFRSRALGRALGFASFPFTPTVPWLGPLGLLPLPSKVKIAFDEPIETSSLGAKAADDFVTVSRLAGQVKGRIEANLAEAAAKRRSSSP